MKNERNIKPISPFILFCQKVIPLAFDESMSYYECLCALTNYLYNNVTPAVNNNADAVTELQTYVANYFKNLDVQTEINNKLDEMAENGQLAEIIAQYIKLNSILSYDNLNLLKNAENITNGSTCRTLGTENYKDGKGNFYKIRTITSSDIVDEINIVSLNISNNLIAEKIPDYYIENLQNQIDQEKQERYILIGDSYGFYRPDVEGIEGWMYPLQRILNLPDNDCYKFGFNGASFIGRPTFLEIIKGNTIQNPETITKIVVCGGANESSYTQENLETAIGTFVDYCKINFPNAKIYIGMIGNYNTYAKLTNKQFLLRNVLPAYMNCTKFGANYLNGVENIMNNYNNYYDDTHPNQNGCICLANGIYQAIQTGYYNTNYNLIALGNLTTSPFSNTETIPFAEMLINNRIVLQSTFNSYGSDWYTLNTPTNDVINLSNPNFSYIRQRFITQNLGNIIIDVKTSGDTVFKTSANMYLNTNNELYLFIDRRNLGNNQITQIRFTPTHIELLPIYY